MVPRRALLSTVSVAIAGSLAGCNAAFSGGSATGTDGPGSPTPTSTPTATLSPPQTATATERSTATSTPSPTPTPTDPPTRPTTATPTTTPAPTRTPTPTADERTAAFAVSATEVGDFGAAVAFSTDRAVVVAPDHAAYVFEPAYASWPQRAALAPADAEGFGGTGVSVALASETVLVGAPHHGDGAVYVFEQVGGDWTQRTQLTPTASPDEYNWFGTSVAYDGDRALVGATTDGGPEVPHTGDVYVFDESGGEFAQADALASDEPELFGTSVALAGDTALVGAPFADVDDRPGVGAAYVYEQVDESWTRRAELTGDDPRAGHRFGWDVALDDDRALVGAPGDHDETGTATVFERADGDWRRRGRVEGRGGSDADFGHAVALDGDAAAVGAPDEGESGAAYALRRAAGEWGLETALAPDGLHPDAEFGAAVSIVEDRALVGAPVFDAPSSAYIFEL